MTNRRRLRGLSLRARVLLIASLLLAVGLAVGSAVVTGFLHGYLISRIDAQLRPMATGMAQQVRSPESFATTIPVGEGGGFWDNYAAFLDPDGGLIVEQRPQGRPSPADPAVPHLDVAAVDARGGRPFDVPSEEGSGSWRVLALPSTNFAVGDGGSSVRIRRETVVVAASLDGVQATITRLNAISLATGAGLLVVLTVVGSFAIRGGLRPLRRIERTLAGVADGDLSQRVPGLAAPSTEIGRLSDALNSMLAQNEAAFAAKERSESRMRRFVADASHELRTPLVGIRGFTKLFRMGALTEQADVERTMDRIERESLRLTRLVEDLLLLARLDEQRDPTASLELAQMDLRTVAADALHDVRARSVPAGRADRAERRSTGRRTRVRRRGPDAAGGHQSRRQCRPAHPGGHADPHRCRHCGRPGRSGGRRRWPGADRRTAGARVRPVLPRGRLAQPHRRRRRRTRPGHRALPGHRARRNDFPGYGTGSRSDVPGAAAARR